MKQFYVLLFLLSALSCAYAQEQPPAPAQEPAVPPVAPVVPNPLSITTKDGLTITPIEVETSDTDAMLNITYWRFKVKKPVDVSLRWRLELREGDKAPVVIKNGTARFLPSVVEQGVPPEKLTEGEFTLGIMPDEGQDIATSPMIKVYMGYRYMEHGDVYMRHRVSKAWTVGGRELPKREKNPAFRPNTSSASTYSLVPAKDDGTIRLMDFETGEKEAPVKCEIVLVINVDR